MRLTTLPTLAVSLLSLAAVLAAPQAQARERHTTVSGSNGHSATRHVSRNQGDVSSSTTGANGKTMSRTVDRSPEGTQATRTGPNGESISRSTNKTDTGSSTTLSTSTGKSATVDVTRQP